MNMHATVNLSTSKNMSGAKSKGAEGAYMHEYACAPTKQTYCLVATILRWLPEYAVYWEGVG